MRAFRPLLGLCLLAALPLRADPLGLVDYEALLTAEGLDVGQIVQSDGDWVALSNGIRLRLGEDGQVIAGFDNEPNVGCVTIIMASLEAAARSFPDQIQTPENNWALALEETLSIYAASVPPNGASQDRVAERFEASVGSYMQAYPEATVQGLDPQQAAVFQQMIDWFGGAEAFAALADLRASPMRLPVSNPCL